MTATTSPPRAPDTMSPVSAAMLVVLSAFLFSSSHATVKYLTQDLHPFLIAFWRSCFAFLPFVPWIARNGLVSMRTRRFGLHLTRACVNASAVLLWFFALAIMPLGDATALSLTGPLFAMAGAALFLGETVGPRRWTALAIGLSGALIIIRPGFEAVSIGAVLVILRGVATAANKVFVKSLTRTEDTGVIVAYVMLLMIPITLIPSLFVWRMPTIENFVILALAGGFSAVANLTMVRAYKSIDVSVAEPIIFTRLVWAALIGYFLFGEFPDGWTWAGGAVIIGATSFIAHREAVLKRAARAGG